MESNIDKKKEKEGGHFLKDLFAIKRPTKQQQHSTLPRMSSKAENDSDMVNKDRLFVRHKSYRKSDRKNKYKKNSTKVSIEKHATESTESTETVKSLREKFEKAQLVAEQSSRLLSTNNIIEETFPGKVLTATESLLNSLKEANKNVEIKRRINDNNKKRERQTKIKSFVEAENEEETEDFRKSFIQEMDTELAKMKEDGYIDGAEAIDNRKDINNVSENDTDTDRMDAYLESRLNYKEESQSNLDQRNSLDSNTQTMIYDIQANSNLETNLNDNEAVNLNTGESRLPNYKEESQSNLDQRHNHDSNTQTMMYDIQANSNLETNLNDNEAVNHNTGKEVLRFVSQSEEFIESLSDDLENGLTIVEAYNDDGRELIEVQVIIDRKVVNLEQQSLQEILKDSETSDMIFYKEEDQKMFKLIQNYAIQELGDNSTPAKKEFYSLPSGSTDNGVYQYIKIPNKENPELPLLIFAPLSKRSTIYSTTSQESSVFDEDDEGISLGKVKDNQEELYSNVRRETFCDNKGIVRIERVGLPDQSTFIHETHSAPVSRSNSTTSCKKLDWIIEEILSTEKKYVDDLAKVVKLYKPFIERHVPSHLKDYQGYLFGNLEKIYRRQRKFLQAIENSGSDLDQIIQCFIDHEILFEMYPNYFRNKPRADNLLKEFSPIIKEMQETFEERLDFSAYLLTPVQRLGRYILFLENIEKQLKKLNLPVLRAQRALTIVKDEMSKGNDSVAIESIENSSISKMDYGSFKMREKFNINKPRKVDAMVFLFSNVVVFTTCDPVKLETFYYYDSIKMNDLRIATFDDLTIHLTDYTKSKKKQNSTKYTYVLETKTEKIWKTWRETIEKMLWDQLVKVKENSISQLAPRRTKKPDKSRIRSVGGSVFYCE